MRCACVPSTASTTKHDHPQEQHSVLWPLATLSSDTLYAILSSIICRACTSVAVHDIKKHDGGNNGINLVGLSTIVDQFPPMPTWPLWSASPG